MENQERVKRVAAMEARMDLCLAAAEELERALAGWEAVREAREALAEYYESPLWREDFEADEAGELPRDLKHGVLSEDGLWDLLARADELDERLWETEAE